MDIKIKELEAQIEQLKVKAEKWNNLEEKIAACYFDEDGNEIEDEEGLITIGEIAATAFGFL